jgi:predicted MPP superfamily phosphohydrolase
MKNKYLKTLIFTIIELFIISSMQFNSARALDSNKINLRFNSSGYFKIVQFADIQDGPNTDERTLNLMNKILDSEHPNLVVLSGDNTDGKCKSAGDIKKAISNIAEPMESRKIPWAVVFGNHDDEHGIMNKEEMMNYYMSFKYNISEIGYKTEDRIGNYNLLIYDSKEDIPQSNIYLLDSGKYSDLSSGDYAYINLNQIAWYKNTSKTLKQKYNRLIPSLMFFHIPLPEFYKAWKTGFIDGERLESESCPKINSKLFDALVKNGDVKGIFVGHDHINSYCASLKGIRLGYARSAGYGTYGKKDVPRGSRVFLIKENDPASFKTWMLEQM